MVIIGYSGTGKSVAIKHIVGLLEPDSRHGLRRRPRSARSSRGASCTSCARSIGYVFQFAALFDSFTIGENVAMGLRKQGELDRARDRRRVHEALDLVDLPNVADRFPAELSGGMRKRVGIARAIALRPKYILYDEPTTGLDPVTSAVIDELMIRMREQLGVTGIVITHDMRSAYTVGTRIAMLYEGTVRQVGHRRRDPAHDRSGRPAVHRRARRPRRAASPRSARPDVTAHAARAQRGDVGRRRRRVDADDGGDAAVPAHPRQLRELGLSQGTPRGRRARRSRGAARGAARKPALDDARARAAASRRSTGTSAFAGG